MSSRDDKPIYSSRADDLDLRDAIDEFVVGLAERVDRFQDAECKGDFSLLSELGRSLVVEANQHGFELLAQSAADLVKTAERQCIDALHQGLVELTRVAQRIRRGHRGAV